MDPVHTEIVSRLEALASPIRLDIFRLLVTHEPVGLVSGEIAEHLGQSHNSISFHLKTLQYAGLVTVQRQGRFQRYRAAMPAVKALVTYLTENCCQGVVSWGSGAPDKIVVAMRNRPPGS
ncbi:MAG: ArsR/SmtB family transcription factor [Acidiferrobacter sp.]